MVTRITDYFLYRWRYLLGYGVIMIMMVALIGVAGFFIPGGITAAEMQSTVTSSSFTISPESFNPETIVNLPYHLLQRLSISQLGVSQFSIKLPSIILGLFSALGLLVLLRMWFKQNVAVITTVLVITTGQFLFLSQSGTPAILYVFWSIWLLVSALMVSRRARGLTLWKMSLFGIGALSLYTPLAGYMILALLSATILHPHLRYIIRHLSRPRVIIGFICGLVLLTPLIYSIIEKPSIAMRLFGIPSEMPDIISNLKVIFDQYLNFINANPESIVTPVYGLGTVLLIVLGLIQLFTTKYTARGYIIITWSILLLPIIVINPQYVTVTFLPVVLLMAMGISLLISRWYRVFPRNPYARIAGLVPLAILIGGMVFSGVERYIYSYLYSPAIASQFSQDMKLLNREIRRDDRGMTRMIVTQNELPFYTTVAKYSSDLTVTVDGTPDPTVQTYIVSNQAMQADTGEPIRILTSNKTSQADRFYIYKNR